MTQHHDLHHDLHLATTAEMRALGLQGKIACPQCGKKTYKVYVTNDGRMLAPECGRCDRENNCQYHLPPAEWRKDNPEGQELYDASRYIKQLPPRKPLRFSIEYAKSFMAGNDHNTLLTWMRSLPLEDTSREWLEFWIKAYCIGTDAYGRTVFWYIDETLTSGNTHPVRSGKMALYKPDGHRDKDSPYNYDWVHTALARAKPHPLVNLQTHEHQGCLFGLHLLNAFPEAEVNIVESEKTALLMAALTPDPRKSIWMATASLNNLNAVRLLPILKQNRIINLWPDHDGFEAWTNAAKLLNAHVIVRQEVERLFLPNVDKDNADIADIQVRYLYDNLKFKQPVEETVSQQAHRLLGLIEENKVLTRLINTFDLTIIHETENDTAAH